MSCIASQSDVWTPDTIATVIYRVVMIAVSLAFLWRQYHLPRRYTDEEYHPSIVVPSRSIPTQSSNLGSSQRHKSSSLLKEVISDQLEGIIQADLGVGDSDSVDSASVSVNLSVEEAHGEKRTNLEAYTPR